MSIKSPRIFSVTVVVYEDGPLAITDSDIRGLIVEVGTFYELFVELRQVASDLMELNHGLTDEQIAESVLHLEFKFVTNTACQRTNSPPTSLPAVLLSHYEFIHPLQYA